MWFWVIFVAVLLLLCALAWYLKSKETPRLAQLSHARQDDADRRARDGGQPPSNGPGGMPY